MKIITRWTFLLLLGFSASLSIYGLYIYRREVTQFDRDTYNDLRLVGLTLRARLLAAAGDTSAARIDRLTDGVQRTLRDINVRWMSLRNAPADLSPKERSELEHGREVLHGDTHSAAPGHTVLYLPVASSTGTQGAIVLSRSSHEKVAYTRHTLLAIFVATCAVLGLSMLLAFFLSNHLVGAPIARIVDQCQRMGDGDFSAAPIDRTDEIGELGLAVNTLCARLADNQDQIRRQTEARIAAVEQARQADRLATVGKLASGVAHELGTPLNVVTGLATGIARGEYEPNEIPETAETIASQARRMTRIVKDVLHFVRRHKGRSATVDLRGLTSTAVKLLTPLARKSGVSFELAPGDPCHTIADGEHLTQVLVNLLQNAVQAQPNGGVVEVEVSLETAPISQNGTEPPQHVFCISVRDRGVGMPPEVLEQIFDPFFTTRDVGQGTGLGLSVVHGIIEEHGGWIDVQSEVNVGTRFAVYLPAPRSDDLGDGAAPTDA